MNDLLIKNQQQLVFSPIFGLRANDQTGYKSAGKFFCLTYFKTLKSAFTNKSLNSLKGLVADESVESCSTLSEFVQFSLTMSRPLGRRAFLQHVQYS